MSTAEDNKILMGLENVHWHEMEETIDPETNELVTTYGAVHRWKGAVNLSVDPQGDGEPFDADNGIYYMPGENAGYGGNLETALIPEDLKAYALGRLSDDAGVMLETSNGPKRAFAITADLTGDQRARRVVFYKVYMGRPTVKGETKKSGSNAPSTETAPITCVPRADYVTVIRNGEQRQERLVHAATNKATNAEAYNAWHTKPYTPVMTPAST